MKPDYKTKALEAVRRVCPELMELSWGCRVTLREPIGNAGIIYNTKVIDCVGDIVYLDAAEIIEKKDKSDVKIIGHTPHFEHWLRLIRSKRSNASYRHDQINKELFWIGRSGHENEFTYNLTKNGDDQSPEFYKAICELCSL